MKSVIFNVYDNNSVSTKRFLLVADHLIKQNIKCYFLDFTSELYEVIEDHARMLGINNLPIYIAFDDFFPEQEPEVISLSSTQEEKQCILNNSTDRKSYPPDNKLGNLLTALNFDNSALIEPHIEGSLNSFMKDLSAAQKILEIVKPSCTISDLQTPQRNRAVLYAAKQKNIKTLSMEHGEGNAEQYNKLPIIYDYFIAYSPYNHDQLKGMGVKEEQIFLTGLPETDLIYNYNIGEIKKELSSQYGIDFNKKIILVALKPNCGPCYINFNKQLLDKCSVGFNNNNDFQIVVKQHPVDLIMSLIDKDFYQLFSSEYKNMKMVRGDFIISKLFAVSDFFLTLRSSAVVEALLQKTPTIVIEEGDEGPWPNWNRFDSYDSIKFDDLEKYLTLIKNGIYRGKITQSENNWGKFVSYFRYKFDEGSTIRIANAIKQIIGMNFKKVNTFKHPSLQDEQPLNTEILIQNSYLLTPDDSILEDGSGGITWEQVKQIPVIRFYAGDIPEWKEYNELIGLSLTRNDQNHLLFDITQPFPLEDNSVDSFQAEDVFEHIPYEKLVPVVNEIYRILKPDGLFRLSVPDYGCDVLQNRSLKDETGRIVFDPEGGGTSDNPGHVWFPRIDTVMQILTQTEFNKSGKIELLHYYNKDGTFVAKPIDYSKGHIMRTPDFDPRVQNPHRPMSLVIDLAKERKSASKNNTYPAYSDQYTDNTKCALELSGRLNQRPYEGNEVDSTKHSDKVIIGNQVNVQHNNNIPEEKPSCIFLNTYYDQFINNYYQQNPHLLKKSYQEQKDSFQATSFGDSDFYSEGLKKAGWDTEDLIINCNPLQQRWTIENGFSGQGLEITIEQIRRKKPQVVYLQNLNVGTADFLSAIRPYTKLIVGQIASPVPDCADLHNFDIIISSFPHFVERFRQAGITSYYQPLAFEPGILGNIPQSPQQYPVTFIGGLSPAHGKGQQILEELSELLPIDFWGYGAESLPENSSIRQHHHGQSWGHDMFSRLCQSTITINRHIDVAENNANNMRLFEATGCGAMLITDYKDNLNELFEIGKEVVAYRSVAEAAALIKYYSSHPEEAEKIAQAGQQRTLKDHTYARRMKQTAEILSRHLRYKREKNRFPEPDMHKISYGFNAIGQSEINESLTTAWQSKDIPAKQRALVQHELDDMYKGKPPTVFQVLADCTKGCLKTNDSILEIGCASGYYYEILEYLLNKRIAYTGVDYSKPLISMAKDFYSNVEFLTANGANLPFDNGQFHMAVSSCILLHVPNYKKHIAETVRVARDFIVAHRTPVCRKRPTQYFKKFAYGVETMEMRFNESEILSEFISHRLKLVKTIEYHSDPEKDNFEVTYLFKKTATRKGITENKPVRKPVRTNSISSSVKYKYKNGPVVLISQEIAFTFPLAYAYLAGYLKEKGEDVRILFKSSDHNSLVKQIMELKPVLVGFGSLYPELKETGEIIHLLNSAGRQFPIVVGGQMVSPTPEFAVEITGADFGVVGEGEIILHQLVTSLRQGRDPVDVKGLVVRDGDKFLSTGLGEFIEDLSNLPPVPYEMFPEEKWLHIGRWYAKNHPQPHWKIEDRVINVHGGRGCPFKCNFCYHHSKPRYRSIDLMMEEATKAMKRFDGNMLYFSDDLVLASPKRAGQLVEAIATLYRPVEYSISARFDILDRLDDELLYKMKRTGCRIMGLGIESGSDRILKIIGKNCTANTVRKGLSRLKKFGILPTVSIMVGQYTETIEDVKASAELMIESVRENPDIQYAFTIATPFPGSPLYDLIFQKGYLRSHREFYDGYFSTGRQFQQVVNLSQMSGPEVLAVHKKLGEIYQEEKLKAKARNLKLLTQTRNVEYA